MDVIFVLIVVPDDLSVVQTNAVDFIISTSSIQKILVPVHI